MCQMKFLRRRRSIEWDFPYSSLTLFLSLEQLKIDGTVCILDVRCFMDYSQHDPPESGVCVWLLSIVLLLCCGDAECGFRWQSTYWMVFCLFELGSSSWIENRNRKWINKYKGQMLVQMKICRHLPGGEDAMNWTRVVLKKDVEVERFVLYHKVTINCFNIYEWNKQFEIYKYFHVNYG